MTVGFAGMAEEQLSVLAVQDANAEDHAYPCRSGYTIPTYAAGGEKS